MPGQIHSTSDIPGSPRTEGTGAEWAYEPARVRWLDRRLVTGSAPGTGSVPNHGERSLKSARGPERRTSLALNSRPWESAATVSVDPAESDSSRRYPAKFFTVRAFRCWLTMLA